jgi:molecular chaperone IbpA
MTQLVFRPLAGHFLGFDRLFGEIERALDTAQNSSGTSFPPFDIYKEDDTHWTIEMAVAGYKREDIAIEHDRRKGLVTVTGDNGPKATPTTAADVLDTNVPPAPAREVVRSGIARRKFSRVFQVADNMVVDSAALTDGMLYLKLAQEVREEDKPLQIALT